MPTTVEQLQYGFDRDSRRTWRQRATTQGWDNAYVYDSLSQVIGDDRGDLNQAQNAIAGIPSNGARWQYDETGNWHGYEKLADGVSALAQSRTHDKGNRLMEVSEAAAMRTDRAGRMLETVPGPGGDWSKGYEITWDAWSRIVGVAGVEGETVTPVATYAYDGTARRITRYIDEADVTLHSYYNDAWRPVEERKDSETTASTSYLWGTRHRDDLVRRDRAVGGATLNETRYILMDYFSPAAITDESGDVTERYQFSAFGLRTILNPDFTVRSASECVMEFSFQGQFEDIETGWLNYGYRYYLPALGRWSCKDPIEEQGGFNLYVITNDNPVNAVDHLGLESCTRTVYAGHSSFIRDKFKENGENNECGYQGCTANKINDANGSSWPVRNNEKNPDYQLTPDQSRESGADKNDAERTKNSAKDLKKNIDNARKDICKSGCCKDWTVDVEVQQYLLDHYRHLTGKGDLDELNKTHTGNCK